jgi:hypothetical protein
MLNNKKVYQFDMPFYLVKKKEIRRDCDDHIIKPKDTRRRDWDGHLIKPKDTRRRDWDGHLIEPKDTRRRDWDGHLIKPKDTRRRDWDGHLIGYTRVYGQDRASMKRSGFKNFHEEGERKYRRRF